MSEYHSKIKLFFAFWATKILTFAVFLSFAVLIYPVISLAASRRLSDPILYYSFSYLYLFASVFLASLAAEKLAGGNLATLGLALDKAAAKNFLAALAATTAASLIFALFYLFYAETASVNPSFSVGGSLVALAIVFISAASEELIFRGPIFQALASRWGVVVAAIATSLFFSLAHYFNSGASFWGLFNAFLAGLIFSAALATTSSLWSPIFLHFLWNYFLALFLDANVSGSRLFEPLFKISFSRKPKILFGGEYGLEGGIAASIALAVLIAAFLKLAEESPTTRAASFKRDFAISQAKLDLINERNN